MNQLTTIHSKEMRVRDIAVNAVNAVTPGIAATDLFLTGKSDEPVRGGWINGQVLHSNGGMV